MSPSITLVPKTGISWFPPPITVCIQHQILYTGAGYSGMKGSVCFVLKFALPPFSSPLPSGVQISKQNRHRTFHTRIFLPLYYLICLKFVPIHSQTKINPFELAPWKREIHQHHLADSFLWTLPYLRQQQQRVRWLSGATFMLRKASSDSNKAQRRTKAHWVAIK